MNLAEPLSTKDRERLRSLVDRKGHRAAKELATRAGVSVATVDRAAAGGPLVRAVRRVLVLELDALAANDTEGSRAPAA